MSTSSTAIVLVGGPSRGTRFRPLSLDVPKPLFKIAGKQIIWHHLEALSKVPDVKDVLLIGFYEEAVFKEFIREASSDFPQFAIKYLREYQSLGTAGGLYLFRDAILKNSPKHIFVMHADICCSFPLQDMLQMHQDRAAVATILGTKIAADAAPNFGCIVYDQDTSEVLHYVEKPESMISNTINCGVYIFDESVFDTIKDAMNRKSDEQKAIVDPLHETDDRLRLEQDILSPLSQTKKMFVYETKGFWRQIKTAGSAVPANALYLQKALQNGELNVAKPSQACELVPPVYIHPTASIDRSAKLGPNVSIGANAKIGTGVRINDSIVLDNVEIRPHAIVLHSIVGADSRVGAWARVEGTPTLPHQHNTTVLRNGVKVQSITVIANNVVIGDEIRLQNCIVLPQKELKGGNHIGEVIM